MLSEIVIAAAKQKHRPGLSISGVFPCPYAIYTSYNYKPENGEADGQAVLRMEDGHWQEEQTVRALARAGIKVEDRQQEVEIGRARTKGHIDGKVFARGKKRLFEHKARSYEDFLFFKNKGINPFPDIYTQIQLYMLGLQGDGIDSAVVYFKHKDSCEPHDVVVPFDRSFAIQIAGWIDKIVLDLWEPEPKENQYCPRCRMYRHCLGAEAIVDFSGIAAMSDEEAVKKWRLGKLYKDFGELMIEETRAAFIEKFNERGLGPGDVLMVDELKISNILQHRSTISKSLFVEKFGAAALLDITEDQEVSQFRILDTAGRSR